MLMIRLRRMGGRNRPYYRVIVSDSRRATSSSALEELGVYDPARNPPVLKVDRERLGHWVEKGARLSPTLKKLLPRASA
jgi:small subunit ribosomal protein S16